MSVISDNIGTIQTLLSSLTWRKIALLTSFLAVVGFSYALFDNRYAVYEFFNSARLIPPVHIKHLSESSVDMINKSVARAESINAIQIAIVDFQRNTRIVVFTSIDNKELKSVYDKVMEKSPNEFPLFNSDIINNKRLVNLVNGEFGCTPYKDTMSAKIVPESIPFVNTLCAGPIPPVYGKFSGIVSIYLSKAPSAVEIEQLRDLSNTLGLFIYNNDLR